jgi:hypothetical protein
VLDGLGEAAEAEDRHRLQGRRLGGVGRRQQDLAGPDGAVETQLAADQAAGERLLRDLLVGREHRQGDGEVEVVAFLAQVGGSEIDDDGLGFQVEAAVLDRGAHPLAALADRGVGKSHDLDLRESVMDVDFDLDGACFDAPWRGCGGSG